MASCKSVLLDTCRPTSHLSPAFSAHGGEASVATPMQFQLIPKGTPLPTSSTQKFSTLYDNQTVILFQVS